MLAATTRAIASARSQPKVWSSITHATAAANTGSRLSSTLKVGFDSRRSAASSRV